MLERPRSKTGIYYPTTKIRENINFGALIVLETIVSILPPHGWTITTLYHSDKKWNIDEM